MRYFLLILLCFSMAGCTTISRTKKLEKQVTGLQEALFKKDESIKIKENQLELKEDQLKKNELEVERLRKKLESLGVFQ